MSVSVVIPTYNRAELLREALASAVAQTLPPLEILVADDGSEEDVAAVVAEFAPIARHLPLAHSGLPAAARNAALQEARGELLAFLDSDDAWRPDKLARQVEAFADGVVAVCSDATFGPVHGGRPYLGLSEPLAELSFEDLLARNRVVTSTVVARREAVERVGRFCEESLLRGLEDYDLWLRLITVGRFLQLGEPLALYREHEGALRAESADAAYAAGIERIVVRTRAYVRSSGAPAVVKEALRKRYASAIAARIDAARGDRRRADVVRLWLRLLAQRPQTAARLLWDAATGRARPSRP
jgi:glycosyltransferase involved in cell wall biosynthesis